MPHALLAQLVSERDQIDRTINDICDQAVADERDPTESERELITRSRARRDQLEPQIKEMVELEERRAASVDAHAMLTRSSPRGGADAGNQSRLPPANQEQAFKYRTFASWARDELIMRYPAVAVRAGDNALEYAKERMSRAMQANGEETQGAILYRQAPPGSTLTADIPGLLPPMHLEQIMQVISRSRPLVEASRESGLNNNGQLTYPQIDQRPTVLEQSGEKEPLSRTPMKVSMQELKAKVYGGSGDLSWQDINWTSPSALALWFDLAAEAYALETEAAACAALVPVVQNVVVPADDLSGWISAITAAAGLIHSSARRAPTALITDITTGYRILGLVSAQMPVFFGAGNANLAQGTGNVAGLTLVMSPGFTAPRVYVGATEQLLRGETPGSPVQLRAVEPSIAGMEVGVIGAFAAKVIELAAFCRLTPPAGTARVAVNTAPAEAGAEAAEESEPEQPTGRRGR
jgi:hypothetical protein